MISEISAFDFDGSEVRTIVRDGDPWFVATDVARILGYRDAFNLLRRLDDDEKGTHSASTPGGVQLLGIVSEAGLYAAILGSQVEQARLFKRWVTHEVLPAIRRTGSYLAQETPEQLMARALVTAQGVIERKDEQIAVLAPRAEAWDELASADGDLSVADASKMLARAGVPTGPQRLFVQMCDLGWTFRAGDGKWRAYASAVSNGYLSERPQSHHHPRTGALVLDAPQVRVTIRGVERLRVRLGVLRAVEVAS